MGVTQLDYHERSLTPDELFRKSLAESRKAVGAMRELLDACDADLADLEGSTGVGNKTHIATQLHGVKSDAVEAERILRKASGGAKSVKAQLITPRAIQ